MKIFIQLSSSMRGTQLGDVTQADQFTLPLERELGQSLGEDVSGHLASLAVLDVEGALFQVLSHGKVADGNMHVSSVH